MFFIKKPWNFVKYQNASMEFKEAFLSNAVLYTDSFELLPERTGKDEEKNDV